MVIIVKCQIPWQNGRGCFLFLIHIQYSIFFFCFLVIDDEISIAFFNLEIHVKFPGKLGVTAEQQKVNSMFGFQSEFDQRLEFAHEGVRNFLGI